MGKKIKKIMKFTITAAVGIHCINRIINYTAGLKKLMLTNDGKYYSWKYGNIFYTKHGNGSPILLIHNLDSSSSSEEWTKIIKKFEKHYTVYAIDLLGCGRSEKPNITYTNYMYVQLINDFTSNIIKEKTTAISTGFSGSFTIMANTMNSDLFKKIIIINPENINNLLLSPTKEDNIYKFIMELPIIGTFIYNIYMHEKNINHIFEEKYYYKKSLISTKLEDTYFESAHIGNGNGRYLLASKKSKYTNINISRALTDMDNLYLIGSREDKHASEIIDGYTSFNKSIESAYISNSMYLPQLEIPEKLYEIIQMFLEN